MMTNNIYIKIYVCFCAIFAACIPHSNTVAQELANYILTETTISNSQQNIKEYQFFDGLGRETSIATNGISTNKAFTYSLKEISGEQQVVKNWLPVVGNANVSCMTADDVSVLSSAQYADDEAYEDSEYDALGRIRQHAKAGSQWKAKPASVSYLTNTSDDVKRYTVPAIGASAPVENGFYKAGTLQATCETNEDGISITTYTDAFGKKILERRGYGNDTYYVYDSFDRLAFVLMPEYQNDSDVESFAFRYEYDLRGNVIKKQLPGCSPIEYEYDNGDRCISMQDGELRNKGLYRFMLYDRVGRLAIQGLSTTKPGNVNDGIVHYVCGAGGIGGSDYILPDSPNANLTIQAVDVVYYYDNYKFMNGSGKDKFQNLSQPNSTNAKGLLVGSIVLASNGESIACVNEYDIRGNLTKVGSRGLGGSIETTENTYTYTNKVASSKSTVSCIGDTSVEYNVRNGYDPKNDFLANTTYQAMIDSVSTEEATMTYAYDDLGRLISVNRPIDGNKGTVSYKYNIQGWLTDIESCSFKEHIYYNEGLGSPLYAGNISSISWNNRVCDRNMGYRFIYDSLNRLTDSEYGEDDFSKSLGNYDERLSYDWNGNVTTLVRNGKKQDGTFGEIDNLSMSYDGNQLYSVEENAASVFFTNAIDLKRSSDEISYNSNGSIVMDGTRGITNIRYDNNNNPVRIQFDNGNVTKYIYSAMGRKLRTIHYTAVDNTHVDMGLDYDDIEQEYLAVDSTDYFMDGNIIFTNGKFSKILFDEGYINADYVKAGPYCKMRPYKHAGMTDEQFAALMERWARSMNRKQMVLSFKFYNKDHLGNIREVVSESDSIEQINEYYPFGTPIHDLGNKPDFQPFKFNGKELDMMHGLNTLDYGARQYNPVLPVWDRVDPLAEDNYGVSPYAYCNNDPVNKFDPNGMDWYQNNDTKYYTWYEGDGEREGYTYLGGKGSLLGEFESKISNILTNIYKNDKGLYSEGRTVDITNPNKGAIIPSKLTKMDDFLDEFVWGYGPEISILTEKHPYTKDLQTDDRVIESQQKLRVGKTKVPGQITDVNRSWGPLDALSTTSMAKQFVGSYTFDSYTANDKKHLLNIIYDTKNFRSLFYHFPGSGSLNHSRNSKVQPLSTTYQFYIWKSKK